MLEFLRWIDPGSLSHAMIRAVHALQTGNHAVARECIAQARRFIDGTLSVLVGSVPKPPSPSSGYFREVLFSGMACVRCKSRPSISVRAFNGEAACRANKNSRSQIVEER